MFLNTLNSAGIATQVWQNATRSLTADPATDAGAATLVWARATRTLTGIGGTLVQTALTSVAATTTVDLRPAAGVLRRVAVATDAAGVGVSMYDGTTVIPTNATTQTGYVSGGSSVGPAIRNTQGIGHNYMMAGIDQTV